MDDHGSAASIRWSLAAGLCALLGAGALGMTACSGKGGDTTGPGHGSGGAGTTGATTSSAGGAGGTGSAGGRPHDPVVKPDLQGRTYDLLTPPGIDKTKPAPLLIMLHGFTDAGATSTPWADMDSYMHMSPETEKRGVLLALGHGSLDPMLNKYFWNGTDACCDFDALMPDDVGYLMGIIEDVKTKYAVDPKRIFAFGHSNGGFMVNRLACDQADKFAAIVSLAGETYKNQKKCAASAPIAYLQVQGDADTTVPYGGGAPEGVAILPPAPGAVETTRDWAAKNRCDPQGDTSHRQSGRAPS